MSMFYVVQSSKKLYKVHFIAILSIHVVFPSQTDNYRPTAYVAQVAIRKHFKFERLLIQLMCTSI